LGCKTFIFHGEIGFCFVQPPKQKQHGHHKQQQNFLQQPMATAEAKGFIFFPKSVGITNLQTIDAALSRDLSDFFCELCTCRTPLSGIV